MTNDQTRYKLKSGSCRLEMVATVIDEPDGFLQPVIGIPTQFLQQWSRVKQQVFMKAKHSVPDRTEQALYARLVRTKPCGPSAYCLGAWKVDGFSRVMPIECFGDDAFFVVLIRNHGVRKHTAHPAACFALADRYLVPYLFPGFFLTGMAPDPGSYFQESFPAFGTKAGLCRLKKNIAIFTMSKDYHVCYNGHGRRDHPRT